MPPLGKRLWDESYRQHRDFIARAADCNIMLARRTWKTASLFFDILDRRVSLLVSPCFLFWRLVGSRSRAPRSLSSFSRLRSCMTDKIFANPRNAIRLCILSMIPSYSSRRLAADFYSSTSSFGTYSGCPSLACVYECLFADPMSLISRPAQILLPVALCTTNGHDGLPGSSRAMFMHL